MLKTIGILFATIISLTTGFSDDFCDQKLCTSCESGGIIPRNVACGDPGSFGDKCPTNVQEIEITPDLQQFILSEHNKIRNKAAGGLLEGFSPCNRMIENTWCPKLAYVAAFNARLCKFEHDKCRNTLEYPYSGQNIAIISSTGDFLEIKAAIKQMFDMWANESKNCPMDAINSYSSNGGPEIGHFTQIVNNKSGKIGCAVCQWNGEEGATTYLVCNYGLTNMSGQKIYPIGKPASGCKSGISTSFPYLCSANEVQSLKPYPYGFSLSSSSSSTSSSSSSSASSYSSSTYTVGRHGHGHRTITSSGSPQTITTIEESTDGAPNGFCIQENGFPAASFSSINNNSPDGITTIESTPQVITYESKPQVITYESKPKIITYESKPEVITYESKPKTITIHSKPQVITYETSPTGVKTITTSSSDGSPFDFSSFGESFSMDSCDANTGSTVVTRKLGNGDEITITQTVTKCGDDDTVDTKEQSSCGGGLFL